MKSWNLFELIRLECSSTLICGWHFSYVLRKKEKYFSIMWGRNAILFVFFFSQWIIFTLKMQSAVEWMFRSQPLNHNWKRNCQNKNKNWSGRENHCQPNSCLLLSPHFYTFSCSPNKKFHLWKPKICCRNC